MLIQVIHIPDWKLRPRNMEKEVPDETRASVVTSSSLTVTRPGFFVKRTLYFILF